MTGWRSTLAAVLLLLAVLAVALMDELRGRRG